MWPALPLLLYLALSFLLFGQTWRDPTRRNIGYFGDPQQFMWFLSWTSVALGGRHNPLFSTYLDYPRGVNLMWNAALVWPGAFLAPITATLGPVFAYNLLVTLALPLSGWSAYLAFRRWTGRVAATVGGLLFAFSPQMAAQGLLHAPVVLALTPPLALLLLTDLLVQRRWPAMLSGAALGVVAAAQVLTWGELLATTAIMAALGLLAAAVVWRPRGRAPLFRASRVVSPGTAAVPAAPSRSRRRAGWARDRQLDHGTTAGDRRPVHPRQHAAGTAAVPVETPPSHNAKKRRVRHAPRGPLDPRVRHALRGFAAAAAAFALIAAAPLLEEFRGPQRIQGLLHHGPPLATDLLNFIVPTAAQLFTSPQSAAVSDRFLTRLPEANAYLGLPLIALLVYIVARRWSSPLVRWAGLMTAVAAILSLGARLTIGGRVTAIPLPWGLIARVPLLHYVMPCRLTMFVYLGAGLLLAIFVDRALEGATWGRLAAAAAVALALLPVLPLIPYPSYLEPTPAFFTAAAVRRIPAGDVALVAPFSANYHWIYSDAMLWQAAARMRFRMPEGYAFVPGPTGDADMAPWPSTTRETMLRIQAGYRSPSLTVGLRHRIGRDLREWHVGTVVVGPMNHQAAMLRLFRFLLQRAPAYVDGVYVWWHVERASL